MTGEPFTEGGWFPAVTTTRVRLGADECLVTTRDGRFVCIRPDHNATADELYPHAR